MTLRATLAVAQLLVGHPIVKGDDPDEKGYHGPPGWGLVVGLTTPPCETYLL